VNNGADEGHAADAPQAAASLTPVATLQLDQAALQIYDLADFNAANLDRVTSFATSFGDWSVPDDVAAALAMPGDARAALAWIHDTGELVLLGGVPQAGEVAVDTLDYEAYTAGELPAFLGGSAAGVERDDTGNAYELFKSEVMPAGTRVALLAHVKRWLKVHELLWGWRRQHDDPDGWLWLVERLARLESETGGHLG
jgi:hypothetical protein